MFRIILSLILLLTSFGVQSVPDWYYGKITRVWGGLFSGGGFVVTFDSSDLSDCKHGYAYFREPYIDSEQIKQIYSMALTAYTTGHKVGVVIDKQGPDEFCYAKSMDMRSSY